MLLNSIIIAITYYLFIYNLMKENPRLQMPNGSELSFSLVGSFRWMVVFFRWKSMTIEQFTDPSFINKQSLFHREKFHIPELDVF